MIDAEKFLNPKIMKDNLVLAALYLAAYELLKSAIIDNIRDFFSFDFIDGKPRPDPEYQTQVTKVHKDVFYASCLWLLQNEIIAEDEVEELKGIRRHRNQIAHELPRLLIDNDFELNLDYFVRIHQLLHKIELWWVKNMEIPANADFDHVSVVDSEIYPGRLLALDLVISAAQGE